MRPGLGLGLGLDFRVRVSEPIVVNHLSLNVLSVNILSWIPLADRGFKKQTMRAVGHKTHLRDKLPIICDNELMTSLYLQDKQN